MSEDIFTIASVHSTRDDGSAFVWLDVMFGKIQLIRVWNSSTPGCGEFFTELSTIAADINLFNGNRFDGDLRSVLGEAAKRKKINPVRIIDPFNPNDGLTIFQSLQGGTFCTPRLPTWPRLVERLNRQQHNADSLAFLQGVLEADRHINRGAVVGFGMRASNQRGHRPFGR